MASIIIRAITKDELENCVVLIRESFSTVAKEFHLTRENCPTNGAFIEGSHLNSDWKNNNRMYGLFEDSVMLGFMELKLKASDSYELEKLAVHPRYRHLGYGGLLIDCAKKLASEAQVQKITLGMIEENTRLKEWYKTHGFIHTGTKKFDHLPFTVGFMELIL